MYDPKRPRRIRNPDACRAVVLCALECAVCGRSNGKLSAHHVVRKGSPWFGDDVTQNLLCLCGDGTTGCHGKSHAGDRAVRGAIGRALTTSHIAYVFYRIGKEAGREFLLREYHLDVEGATWTM